jgi:putative transposase
VERIVELRSAIARVRRKRPFVIDAWVVLPEHMHCVWTLPEGDADYSSRWQAIKILFSRSIPATEQISASRRAKHERGIWQRRFWEHTITSDTDYERHVDYVHLNPVKHGLVTRVADWPYSTFHRYVAAGIYANDWLGG